VPGLNEPEGLSPSVVMPAIRRKVAAGEQVLLTVTGTSMAPTLKDRRDAVLLEAIGPWPPPKGTILLIQRADGSPVLHRVIRVVGQSVVLNGDGQIWMEGPIPEALAVARAAMVRRKGRFYHANAGPMRLYCLLWMALRPLRRRIFRAWRYMKKYPSPAKG
jgi:hypothetical protein